MGGTTYSKFLGEWKRQSEVGHRWTDFFCVLRRSTLPNRMTVFDLASTTLSTCLPQQFPPCFVATLHLIPQIIDISLHYHILLLQRLWKFADIFTADALFKFLSLPHLHLFLDWLHDSHFQSTCQKKKKRLRICQHMIRANSCQFLVSEFTYRHNRLLFWFQCSPDRKQQTIFSSPMWFPSQFSICCSLPPSPMLPFSQIRISFLRFLPKCHTSIFLVSYSLTTIVFTW